MWRFTEPQCAVFSDAELERLHPLGADEAERIYRESLRFLGTDGLEEQQFESVLIRRADISTADGCSWLRSQCADLSEQVTLSWLPGTALRTNWDFFTARWDDFCYGASDDLIILPDSGRWVLFYHHEEEFHFASRNA